MIGGKYRGLHLYQLSVESTHSPRHGRACPGHPRLWSCSVLKTWMPATSAGMTSRESCVLVLAKRSPPTPMHQNGGLAEGVTRPANCVASRGIFARSASLDVGCTWSRRDERQLCSAAHSWDGFHCFDQDAQRRSTGRL